jgi:hypothetical protein
MAIEFMTSDPRNLLSTFKGAIDDRRIVTWSYDQDRDFTHTAEQWKKLAWLRPKISDDYLLRTILKPDARNISTEIYAIYHGRFIEAMLSHCDKLFTRAVASALPGVGDVVS